jgi:hypothetical protein
MNRLLYQITVCTLLGVLVGWVGYLETVRFTQLREITNAQRIVEHERGHVLAIQQAQAQAEPLMDMVKELARQNTAYIKVVDEARCVVAAKNAEASRNKKAVDHSVELLRKASVEHNRSIDHIRKLERFIDKLLKKIPENDRPDVPKLGEEKPEPQSKKWS